MALILAHDALVLGLFRAGYVLEELLDEVDVCKDHAAAAVALEADGVEGVARRGEDVSHVGVRGGLYGGWGVARLGGRMGGVVLPFGFAVCEESHVSLPEVADDLRGG